MYLFIILSEIIKDIRIYWTVLTAATFFSIIFAITESVATICVPIFNSSGEKPNANPISCGRCNIGIPNLFSIMRSVSGCIESRFRWQRGQGVTMQSAPLSLASSVCFPAIFKDAFLFIIVIGNPQHFVLPSRSEEHTSELQSQFHLVCRLLLEKK